MAGVEVDLVDVVEPGGHAGGEHGSYVVTVRTPAGSSGEFRVTDATRVETLTHRAVAQFKAHGQLGDGNYRLSWCATAPAPIWRPGWVSPVWSAVMSGIGGHRSAGGWLMLHPVLLAELLDDEVAAAAERLGTRAEALGHDGRYVRCRVTGADGALLWLRMDTAGYDADPGRQRTQ